MNRKKQILLDAVREEIFTKCLDCLSICVKFSEPLGEVKESLFPPYGGEY